jgi:hypothetical protein
VALLLLLILGRKWPSGYFDTSAAGLNSTNSALSPTPPFRKDTARFKFGGALLPILLLSLVLRSAWVMRGTTFLLGAAFFGQPGINVGWRWLNTNYPTWAEKLDLNK